jgi:hypothetical protein
VGDTRGCCSPGDVIRSSAWRDVRTWSGRPVQLGASGSYSAGTTGIACPGRRMQGPLSTPDRSAVAALSKLPTGRMALEVHMANRRRYRP